jgi:peptidoglycan hydrolase-like protein with peptidoglycan-binding domain
VCNVGESPEFVASLQRALKARGHLNGEISGILDGKTRRAIRSYQAAQGLNSDILASQTARELGLVAYARDDG